MVPRTSIFGVIFVVSKLSLFWELRTKETSVKNIITLTRKPRSHVTILIYRTWPIGSYIELVRWPMILYIKFGEFCMYGESKTKRVAHSSSMMLVRSLEIHILLQEILAVLVI